METSIGHPLMNSTVNVSVAETFSVYFNCRCQLIAQYKGFPRKNVSVFGNAEDDSGSVAFSKSHVVINDWGLRLNIASASAATAAGSKCRDD